jgi:arginyl-tRNA synthetase
MKPVITQVSELFQQALRTAFPSVAQEVLVVKGNPKFGDYQCNNAMGLFKEHGKALNFANPGAMAEAIKAGIPKNDILGSVTVAPQGFVTVKLSEAWLAKQLAESVLSGGIECPDVARKRVVVDFSSPNIAKDMHVGHLRSTIIGESTCRLLEFCGHEVHRLNHVGDWGTQFGMLIEYMKETFPDFQQNMPEVADLQEFYKASKKRFDDDEDFKRRAQLAVVDLQSGGAAARSAWQMICQVSRKAYDKIYGRLGIVLEERGESFYNSLIPPLVEELKIRKICKESDGAMCIWTPNVKGAEFPLMAVKSDGGFGYDSTDLAAIYHRLFVMRSDWIVYVTDLGQETHFYMIFDAAQQAGWHRPGTTRCDHMGFGVVQGEDKKKFKTRSGETVKLSDLLDEAVERAKTEIQERVKGQAESGGEVFLATDAEQQDAAEKLGIAAVRYFDMKQNRTSDYVFSYDRMLDAKGNSAVFLFYAYARICSIGRKAETNGVNLSKLPSSELKVEHPSERELALMLLRFPDVIKAILADLHLHQLTDYLWELCNMFTAFYRDCHVIGEAQQTSRLLLCEATRKVLFKAFFLLGFTPLEKI